MTFSKFAEKPSREVNEMRALIDQVSAARHGTLEAPFLFIAQPAAVTVAPAYKQQRPEISTIDDLARLENRRMEAVIVTDLGDKPSGIGRILYSGYLGEVSSSRLFDEHMLAAKKARCGDFRQLPVRGCNHDHVDVGCLDNGFEIGRRTRVKRVGDFYSTVS